MKWKNIKVIICENRNKKISMGSSGLITGGNRLGKSMVPQMLITLGAEKVDIFIMSKDKEDV